VGEERDLQFEKAEYSGGRAASATCAFCRKEIADSYYGVGDKVACERCRMEIELERSSCSGAGRFARAAMFGSAAAALGAGLYFGVAALTGYEFGLIAIVVGFMVGAAVRAGSKGRGGWLYQGLAMFLTYNAIVATYVPQVYKALRDPTQTAEGQAASDPGSSPAAGPGPETPAAAPETPQSPAPPERVGLGTALLGLGLGLAFLFVLAYAVPFLAVFESGKNVIGLVIVGIGLYEAWKLNKRVPLEITGPFRVGAAPPPAGPSV
jgi:hypothetical protein